MPSKVLIPTPLRPYTNRQEAVEIEGATVGELLTNLTTRYKDLRRHLYTEDGRLRNFVNVYLNDEDIRYLDRENTVVATGDTISIIPSVAGGASSWLRPSPFDPSASSGSSRAQSRDDDAQGAPSAGRGAGGSAVVDLPDLTNDEIKRYSRHLIMPEVGMDGQRKLKAARVLCIGAGGLGSPVAMYLAAAGVGTIGLIDFDTVDFSNLQRQILHGTPDVGRPKLVSARERLNALNPEVKIETFEEALTSKNALQLFKDFDVIVDGTDNFPTRYLVNDACVLLKKPNAYGSIFRFEGQASVFAAADGPCYRCLYPEPPPPGLVPSCAEGGVLGVLPGVIGTIQATETLKLLLGAGDPLIGRLLVFDALRMRFRELRLRRDPECPVCGDRPTVRELIDYDQFCGVRPHPAHPPVPSADEILVEDLHMRILQGDAPFILDVREPQEYQINRITGSKLIPLGELSHRVDELEPSREIVVHCKSGVRSAKAAELLRSRGFTNVKNLRGGIIAWVDRVDPSQPKY